MAQRPVCSPLIVSLTCKDIKASIRFYRDVLGFQMHEIWPSDEQPLWCSLMLADQSVMLGQAMSPEETKKMAGEDESASLYCEMAETFANSNQPGAGVIIYVKVDDVDQFHATIKDRGATPVNDPRDQFYGIREFFILDPDGYRLVFYKNITMSSCSSCGIPLTDAAPGDMYCDHCTDDNGKLRPFEDILEGTITGYFMGMQKMERAEAEVAAKEHLAKMPAWQCGTGS